MVGHWSWVAARIDARHTVRCRPLLEARVTASAALMYGHLHRSRRGPLGMHSGRPRDEKQEHQVDEDDDRPAGCAARMVASLGGRALTIAPLAY